MIGKIIESALKAAAKKELKEIKKQVVTLDSEKNNKFFKCMDFDRFSKIERGQ